MEDKKVIRGTFPVRWHKDGQDGKDGTNVWMKYAKTLDKGTYPSTMYDTFSSDMNYIGIGNGRGAEPIDPSKYAWKKIKGEDGTSFTAKGNAIAHYANKAAYEAATKTAGLYLYDDSAGAKLVQWNGSATTEMSVATGDAYTTSDMHLWVRDETKWVDLGMIQGPAGTPGDDGESYWIVPSSETVPLDSSGYPISTSISATAWCKIGKTEAKQIKNNKGYTLSVAADYKDGTVSEVTQMDDNGTVTLSYAIGMVVQSVTMKLKEGKTILDIRNLVPSYDGKNGTDGKNAIRLDLDNENDTMLYDSNRQLVSGDIITNAQLYDGAKEVESNLVTYDVDSSEGCTYKHIENSSQFTVTGMTAAVGWLRIKATYNGADYLATLTLKKIVGQCKYDIVTSVSAITKNANTGTLSPGTVTAYIRKTDASGNVTTTEGTASGTANSIDGKSLQVYIGGDWLNVKGTSINTSGYDLMLRISDGTYVYDQETLPLIISGKNGTNGDDAVSYWLDCSHMAVPCTSDGKARSDVSIKITAWQKIGNNNPVQLNESNCVKYTFEYEADDANQTYITVGSTNGSPTTIIPDTSRVLKSVNITLKISGKIIQTITLLPVLDGPMGNAGYDYIPRVLGLWDSTHQYYWDEIERQGFLYLSNGSYDLYYVKNRMTWVPVGTKPTGDTGDPYFVKASKWYTIYTEALYTPNASIGGFSLSDKMFISAEISYTMTYRGTSSEIRYRGSLNSSTTYQTNDVVYSNGSYYIYTSSSSRKKLSESSKTDKYIIDMVSGYSTTNSVSVTLYGYYDSSTKDRPFVYYNGKFWTTKKYGKATDYPSETSACWRELFDAEKLMLGITDSSNGSSFEYSENSIYTRSISRYMLNGKEGTSIMLQPDDTVWTYDMTGKQTMGIPYSKRVEIVPTSKSVDVYDEKGELALQVNGDTYETIDKAYGSGTLNPSCSTTSGSLTSDYIGTQKTTMSIITNSNFVVKDYALNLSVECAYRVTAEEKYLTTTPNGSYGNIIMRPYQSGGQWIYRSDCQGSIIVQKLSEDGLSWSNHNLLTLISTMGISGITARYSGTLNCVLQPGTYRLVFVFTADLFGSSNTGSQSTCSYNLTHIKATGNYAVKTSRVFSNGLAFGSATDDNFVVCREKEGIHVKASTSSNYGFELSQTKGLEVKRKGQQGIVPVLLYAGRSAYLSTGKSQKTIYQYSDGDVKYDWTHIGICEITFPWDCDNDKCVPTVTTWQGVTGVSARIVSWNVRKMVIEIDNDYSGGAGTGSDHDYGGFYIKLEYIG